MPPCRDEAIKLGTEAGYPVNLGGEDTFVFLQEKAFRAETAQIMMVRKIGDNGPRPKQLVSPDVVESVFYSAWQFLPETPELIHTPIIGRDGSLIDQPGWHYRNVPSDARAIST